ncbi:MAG: 16S rRNA (cytidine(1402)-2'-O)-methyltransferase [Gammaproteobacteria bacterium]|nr:16S rRNA (cytidine(1402)-2'-O)-methyltransferase [Gammaproteobacteria bacterium]NIN62842.1 16S rRNA (cytidine(1402)-2'-O)-methyltransferase [Gammaproteobacteria bacterium]NIO63823.1 16S rRNA (cytidine(1402)-2'-O)-methyltransferase [Gammaproteobacteria bacterium]NIP50201.1 16S rRNA (cytidine(1402)-2'-O)-methyltransferase [Gammaproteobacteria bacterium]NIQ12419.1 16S rRNA (cytidine(1402)-2'-O)-methyltransferase [Gammaproteobacteria bacterium]
MQKDQGTLYVVATPLGNLDDLSPRAVRQLNACDRILAEDTRHSRKLLEYYAITTPMQAYHDFNEAGKVTMIIGQLQGGLSMALISDAGTPLINDPGFKLVNAAHKAGIPVVTVPGPSAVIAALSVAGLPTDRFVFEGFLPDKRVARKRHLQSLANEQRTLVFYEVPHRIRATLDDLSTIFGRERKAVIAKELTKQHESVRRGTLEELIAWLDEDTSRQKGEFVLMVSGATPLGIPEQEARRILSILMREMSVKQAATVAADILGESKNRLYKLALEMKEIPD